MLSRCLAPVLLLASACADPLELAEDTSRIECSVPWGDDAATREGERLLAGLGYRVRRVDRVDDAGRAGLTDSVRREVLIVHEANAGILWHELVHAKAFEEEPHLAVMYADDDMHWAQEIPSERQHLVVTRGEGLEQRLAAINAAWPQWRGETERLLRDDPCD